MGQFKESTMKSFAFVCLFAAAYAAPAADADAEADPALLYSSLGYGGYTGYAGYHHPYTYGAYAPYVAAVPAVHSAAVKSVVETPAEVKTTVHAAPVVTYNAVHHASPVVYNTASRRLPRRVQHRRRSRRPEGRLLRQLWRRCPHCQEGG